MHKPARKQGRYAQLRATSTLNRGCPDFRVSPLLTRGLVHRNPISPLLRRGLAHGHPISPLLTRGLVQRSNIPGEQFPEDCADDVQAYQDRTDQQQDQHSNYPKHKNVIACLADILPGRARPDQIDVLLV